jgi:hypothetical protein
MLSCKGMDKIKRAAALLGQKGGKVKGPKGFATSGKASEAGKKTALKRWGKRCRITLEFIYLPRDEQSIIDCGRRLPDAQPLKEVADYTAPSAIDNFVVDAIVKYGGLEGLGVFLNHTWLQPSKETPFTPDEQKIMSLRGRHGLITADGFLEAGDPRIDKPEPIQ